MVDVILECIVMRIEFIDFSDFLQLKLVLHVFKHAKISFNWHLKYLAKLSLYHCVIVYYCEEDTCSYCSSKFATRKYEHGIRFTVARHFNMGSTTITWSNSAGLVHFNTNCFEKQFTANYS